MSKPTHKALHELTNDEAIAWLWRRGRSAAALGALISLVATLVFGLGLVALLSLIPSRSRTLLSAADIAPFVVRGAGLVVLGAAIGLMITSVAFNTRSASILGSGTESKRIRRAVLRNDPTPLTADEQARAAAYAPLAEGVSRFMLVSLGVLYVGILLQQIPQFLQPPSVGILDLRALSTVSVVLLLATFAVALPLQLRVIARAHRYATAHGHPADLS